MEPTYADQDRYTCPTCKTVLSPDTFKFAWSEVMGLGSGSILRDQKCSACGHPFTAKQCKGCSKGIFQGTEVSVLGPGGYTYYHKTCKATAPPPLPAASKNPGCAGVVLLLAVGLIWLLV